MRLLAALILAVMSMGQPALAAKKALSPEELNAELLKVIDTSFVDEGKVLLPKAKELLDAGANVNGDGKKSPLYSAACSGKEAIFRLLLERGADLDIASPGYGWSALHCAAANGRWEMAELLLDKGAKCCEDSASGTPYDTAKKYDKPAVIRVLKKHGAAVTAGDAAPVTAVAPRAAAPKPTSPDVKPKFSAPENPDDYAVVVGVEKYEDLPAASYAERDAKSAREFFRALGVPERNIMTLTGTRATRTGLEKAFEAWLPNNVSEKSRVFVFYSGHGAPDPKTKDAYLVPSDGDPQYLTQTGYPLKRLYAKLGELKVKSVLVALDSCFSGAGGRSVLAKGTRPLVGKIDIGPKADPKIAVLAASAGDQISGSDEASQHGLFTYNLLNGLNGAAKNEKGQVTLQSLYDYVKPKVQDEARRANREQTPQLQCPSSDSFILRAN